MNFEVLWNYVINNQFLTGLTGATVLGAVLYQIRTVPQKLRFLFERLVTLKLTVISHDATFLWIEKWLVKQPYAKKMRETILRISKGDDVDDNSPVAQIFNTGLNSEKKDSWILVPGENYHWFFWNKRLVIVHRRSDASVNSGGVDSRRGGGLFPKTEYIDITIFSRSISLLPKLVQEAYELVIENSKKVEIMIWVESWWARAEGKEPRDINSIILPEGQMERILEDINKFSAAKEWYKERGVPYRRGYLFSGPPGTGKTSLVSAIAGYVKRPICILSLNSTRSDDSLMSAIREAPANAIIVMEDIDCAGASLTREKSVSNSPFEEEESGVSKLSKSIMGSVSKAGLLNALDGIMTPEGRIFIMTTNYPEKLDPALIRRGRADVHEKFELLSGNDQVRMAKKFYSQDIEFEPLPRPITPATLQGVFLEFSEDPVGARKFLEENIESVVK